MCAIAQMLVWSGPAAVYDVVQPSTRFRNTKPRLMCLLAFMLHMHSFHVDRHATVRDHCPVSHVADVLP
jgi:hypothetical protein